MSPGRGLLRLLAVWLLLAVVAAAWPVLRPLWILGGGAIVLFSLLALLELRRPPRLEIERRVPSQLPLGQTTEVELRVRSREPRALDLEIFDHYPTSAELEGLPQRVQIPALADGVDAADGVDGVDAAAGEGMAIFYRLRPRRRGDVEFSRVEVWRHSSFDLWRRRFFFGAPREVRVLPNFRPTLIRGLAGLEERLAQVGVHLQRRRGEGLEFQELRDYRPGDTQRQINWKATARRGQLVTRQYQDDRNQQLVLLLDCGRRMHAREGELTHFDHVLDAALLLAWVALRQGDAVGVQAFAGDRRWLPPVRGRGALERLLDAIYDLETSTESPDFPAAAALLMERQRRRALVLLLTNLRDEDDDELIPAIRTLRRRHLVLVASTRELALGRLRDQPVENFRAAKLD